MSDAARLPERERPNEWSTGSDFIGAQAKPCKNLDRASTNDLTARKQWTGLMRGSINGFMLKYAPHFNKQTGSEAL